MIELLWLVFTTGLGAYIGNIFEQVVFGGGIGLIFGLIALALAVSGSSGSSGGYSGSWRDFGDFDGGD